MEPPRRFISKNRVSRNCGGDDGDERDMVRRVTGNGSEGGRGETGIPGIIDEIVIQMNESRNLPTIRPGVLAVN
jgi:hypothetical protein